MLKIFAKIVLLFALVSKASAFDFYVSADGKTGNPGTSERPFKSIQQAAMVMRAGDVCHIGGGVYRESVTPRNDGSSSIPITFQPVAGETVILAATKPVGEWTLHQGNIYKASVKMELGDRNMLLFNGELMQLARWPNDLDGDPFTIDALWRQKGSDDYLMHVDIPEIDWAGGVLWFLGTSRWTSWRRPITRWDSALRRIYFDLPGGWEGSQHSPAREGEFYLMNKLEALDAPGEWYYDEAEEMLYFQAPGNVNPNSGDAQIRTIETLFDLQNSSYITIKNLNLIGGGVNMENARGCVLENVRIKYGNHTIASNSAAFVGDASVKVSGSNNLIKNCQIEQGASYGISLGGSANRVENCLVHDFNWLGSYSCPIYISGTHNRVTHSTFYNGGRDVVRMGGQGHDFSYNDVYNSNLINDDCGLLYTCCHDGEGTRIHHNWFHDAQSRDTHYKAAGVYLDNSTQTYDVFNNVIWNLEWSAVQINWDGWNLNIFHNTIWNVGHSMAAWHKEGTSFKDVLVYNNLSNDGQWDGTDYKTNLVVNEMPFESLEERDFQLKPGSRAIDFGTPIDGFTDSFVGSAPDAGAYEYGADYWTAGIDWSPEPFDWTIAKELSGESGAASGFSCFPNPFTKNMVISFAVSQPGPVDVIIYNALGQRVAVLAQNENMTSGSQSFNWNGRNQLGQKAAAGTYFVKISAEGNTTILKCVYLTENS